MNSIDHFDPASELGFDDFDDFDSFDFENETLDFDHQRVEVSFGRGDGGEDAEIARALAEFGLDD